MRTDNSSICSFDVLLIEQPILTICDRIINFIILMLHYVVREITD